VPAPSRPAPFAGVDISAYIEQTLTVIDKAGTAHDVGSLDPDTAIDLIRFHTAAATLLGMRLTTGLAQDGRTVPMLPHDGQAAVLASPLLQALRRQASSF
jgi:hypothetical protein